MSAEVIKLHSRTASYLELAEQYLEARGITLAQAAQSGIEPHPDANELYSGFKKRPALLINYPALPTGEAPTFEHEGQEFGFARVRYLGDGPKGFTNSKTQRFAQPAGSEVYAYFPICSEVSWQEVLADASHDVLIVEGELKAVAGCLNGFAVVGIGGVSNIRRKDGSFLSELAALAKHGRRFFIAFDSDITENPAVLRAERVLADELRKHGALSVRGIRLPSGQDGSKQGLDDFLKAEGPEALEALADNSEEVDTSPLPIRITPHRLLESLDDLDAAIAASDEPAFQRSGQLVHVSLAGKDSDDSVKRDEATPLIKMLTTQSVQQLAMNVARFEKWDGRKKAHVPTQCPADLAAHYLQRLDGWTLPRLSGIVEAPTLRSNGSVLQEPGYDAETGVLYIPSAEFTKINPKPRKKDALAALEKLCSVVRGLEFQNEASRSVWLAAVITALVRKALPSAPMFGISAVQPGTGKTLAANLIGIIATGHNPATLNQGGSAEEDRKRFFSALLAGDSVLNLDNCDEPVEGAALCSILTSRTWSDRYLGQSKNVAVATNVTLLATGNKLTFSGDMCRRALLCKLASTSDRPAERVFDWRADEEALRDRPALVEAALTVVLAYFAAREPHVDALPFGSFETWQRFVQRPLLWLGVPDPCATLKDVEVNDPDRAELEQLLHLWSLVFGERPVRAREFSDLMGGGLSNGKAAKEHRAALYELVMGITGSPASGELNTKSLGKYLLANEGRPIDGKRLTKGRDAKLKLATWRVC